MKHSGIFGKITLEDTTIEFKCFDDNTAEWTISEENVTETLTGSGEKFMTALSIAVHWDGDPNAKRDYPLAEEIMGKIRWIP